MKAYLLHKSGGPQKLALSEVKEPVPGGGEVRVKVHYVGINYAEILSRKGLYGWDVKRPYVPGMECAGVIEKAGDGVDPSRVGERVMVGAKYGAYAEKIVVPAVNAAPALEQYSLEESASFLVNYMTAWVSLVKMARITPRDSLLVTAAAGGVGTAAVQLASKMGCKVYGMAGSEEKIELINSLGAKRGFNYRNPECFKDLVAETGGIDVVLEMVGGNIFKHCLDCMNPFGRVVVAGFASLDLNKWNPVSWVQTWMDIPRADVGKMARRSIGVMSSHLGYLLEQEPKLMRGVFSELSEFVTERGIRPVVGKVFPFEQAGEAHRYIESRKSVGKVLLKL